MTRIGKKTTKDGKPLPQKKLEPRRPHFVSSPTVALPLPGIRHPRNPGSGKFVPIPKITVAATPESKRDRTLMDAGRIRKKNKDTPITHHPGPVSVKRDRVSFKDAHVHHIAATPGKTPTVLRIEIPPTQMVASPLERRKRGPAEHAHKTRRSAKHGHKTRRSAKHGHKTRRSAKHGHKTRRSTKHGHKTRRSTKHGHKTRRSTKHAHRRMKSSRSRC